MNILGVDTATISQTLFVFQCLCYSKVINKLLGKAICI